MVDFRKLLTRRDAGIGTHLLRWLLRLASVPYTLAVWGKNRLYDWGIKQPYQSGLPVVSVGNVSVGGTGKSPAVAWLAKWFRSQDIRVAVLSRGYGALDSGQNDEALELELQFPDVPHLQHWDRIASAQLAKDELEMQVLVLDDGFQHRRIARDLEIVLLDATDPSAARWPLPGGLLREPLSSLRRADIILLTRCDQAKPEELQKLKAIARRKASKAIVLCCSHQPSHLLRFPQQKDALEKLRGAKVLAFCGIGNPASFFSSLSACGAIILDSLTFPDHHGYDAADVDRLSSWTENFPDASMLVCTMKDWVKLQTADIGTLPLHALAIEMQVADAQPLESQLADLLRR